MALLAVRAEATLSPSHPRLWSHKHSAYGSQLIRGDGGSEKGCAKKLKCLLPFGMVHPAWCRVRRGLASTGGLSSCSNLPLSQNRSICKTQSLLEVTPQALSDSHHHSPEVIEQLLEQVHDKSLSTPVPPAPLLDLMISSEMIQQ